MSRCAAAREARDRHVEPAPEKMDRAYLAEESRAKAHENALDEEHGTPEAPDRVGVVGTKRFVFGEGNRLRHLVGPVMHVDLDAELCEGGPEATVKIADRS